MATLLEEITTLPTMNILLEKLKVITADELNVVQTQFPAPDFVIEILSPSTADRNRGVKMVDYAAHGLREYWIVDADSETVERYRLDGDRFTFTETVTESDLRRDVIAGFSVPLDAIFDEAANMEAQREILLA